jgi:hypothetical protein
MIEDSIIPAILGRPTFASLVVSYSIAFADLESTFPAASYSGRYAVVVINGMNVLMQSDGTAWKPANGQCTLDISGTGYGIMPSGTISTGASGHFVSGTAFPYTYSEGLWMYIVSAGTTPALAAGFYWCVFSNTTTCTIYTNGPGSAAYNFTVGAATTGSTSEITARSVTIPAGLMGESGQLVCNSLTSLSATASSRSLRTRFGGSQTCVMGTAVGTTTSYSGRATTQNASALVQYSNPAFTGSTSTSTLTRTTIDTTAETTYTLTLQMGTATDFIINHSFRLDLYK